MMGGRVHNDGDDDNDDDHEKVNSCEKNHNVLSPNSTATCYIQLGVM